MKCWILVSPIVPLPMTDYGELPRCLSCFLPSVGNLILIMPLKTCPLLCWKTHISRQWRKTKSFQGWNQDGWKESKQGHNAVNCCSNKHTISDVEQRSQMSNNNIGSWAEPSLLLAICVYPEQQRNTGSPYGAHWYKAEGMPQRNRLNPPIHNPCRGGKNLWIHALYWLKASAKNSVKNETLETPTPTSPRILFAEQGEEMH